LGKEPGVAHEQRDAQRFLIEGPFVTEAVLAESDENWSPALGSDERLTDVYIERVRVGVNTTPPRGESR
jgi:hypothetical protein